MIRLTFANGGATLFRFTPGGKMWIRFSDGRCFNLDHVSSFRKNIIDDKEVAIIRLGIMNITYGGPDAGKLYEFLLQTLNPEVLPFDVERIQDKLAG